MIRRFVCGLLFASALLSRTVITGTEVPELAAGETRSNNVRISVKQTTLLIFRLFGTL